MCYGGLGMTIGSVDDLSYLGVIYYYAYWNNQITQAQLLALKNKGKITQEEYDWIIVNPPG